MSVQINKTTEAKVVFTPKNGTPFAARYVVDSDEVALSVGSGTIRMGRMQLLELADAIPEIVKDLK